MSRKRKREEIEYERPTIRRRSYPWTVTATAYPCLTDAQWKSIRGKLRMDSTAVDNAEVAIEYQLPLSWAEQYGPFYLVPQDQRPEVTYGDEHWKYSDELPDYWISNYGRIYSLRWFHKQIVGRIIAGQNQITFKYTVHNEIRIDRRYLIAAVWLDPPPFPKAFVRFKDSSNEHLYHISNIEYVYDLPLPNEQWQPIPISPLHEVSSEGRARNRETGRLIKIHVLNGYCYLCLAQSNYFLSRIVAEAHIPIPERLQHLPRSQLQVNHLNGKLDNTIRDLEWVTASENTQHAVDTGRIVSRRQVQQLDANTNRVVRTFASVNEAAQFLGVKHSTDLSKRCRREDIYRGYRWRYVDGPQEILPVYDWQNDGKEWRTIPDDDRFVGYRFSDEGDVLGRRGRLVQPQIGSERYPKIRSVRLHRLICRAFHGPPPFAHAHVDHLDDNPLNNRADNLQWVSQQENTVRGRGQTIEYVPCDGSTTQYRTIQDAAKTHGFVNTTIRRYLQLGYDPQGGTWFRCV